MPVGSNVDLGLYYRIEGLSAGSLNADLVSAMDVSNYKWISVYIGSSTYVGRLTFQCSFDITDPNSWQDITIYKMTTLTGGAGDGVSTTESSIIFGSPVWFPFFRVRMTEYTSGTATGILQLHTDGLPGFQILTVGANLNPTNVYAGFFNNDGNKNVAIASGHVADTIVSAIPGMLARVLVTSQNTNQMLIYDNASTTSGTIIGIIPANQPVDGKALVFKMPAQNGIYVAGNANNPGVTISYT